MPPERRSDACLMLLSDCVGLGVTGVLTLFARGLKARLPGGRVRAGCGRGAGQFQIAALCGAILVRAVEVRVTCNFVFQLSCPARHAEEISEENYCNGQISGCQAVDMLIHD